MIETIKKYLIWIGLAALMLLSIATLHQCDSNAFYPPQNGKKVDTVLMVRHDTINKIQTELKIKTIYIDTGRIEYIHDTLDHWIKPVGNENICIAENQLRQCVKCQDSLEAYKDRAKVDSIALDSVAKIAKAVPYTIKITPSVFDRVKDFGACLLVGAGIKLLF